VKFRGAESGGTLGVVSELEEGAWICPDCGQWGTDKFGPHSLPDQPVATAPECGTRPVQIPLGPFARRCRQNACEVTREAVTGFVDLKTFGCTTAETAKEFGRRRVETFAAFDLTPPDSGLTIEYLGIDGVPAKIDGVR
jgi:hypothetical protein